MLPLRTLRTLSSSSSKLLVVDYQDQLSFWKSYLGDDHANVFNNRRVRIYEPGHHAMQNMPEKDLWNKRWLLDFEPKEMWNNSLMGWTSTRDPVCHLKIRFPSLDKALAFAQKHGMTYTVYPAHQRKVVPKSYAANFKWKGNQ